MMGTNLMSMLDAVADDLHLEGIHFSRLQGFFFSFFL